MVLVLEQFFGYLQGKRHGAKRAMRELEISLRARDPVTPVEDTDLYANAMNANVLLLLTLVGSGSFVWFATRKAPKFLGIPPLHRLLAGCYSLGCAEILADIVHYEYFNEWATLVLEDGEEHMKMELAKIILNNHSTDELLVEAVKRHFIAENLLSDEHQEQRLFRWRQRNSYVDYTFKERMKESEANSSDDDEAVSSVNTRLFEDISLACILDPPGSNTEMSKSPEHIAGTVLTRSELQGQQRSHRHRHRLHTDTTAELS